ncbi:AAA family ATPase [Aurantimonas marianensis]|uniref:AAA family ATPase n=1 Tax=Aurantimonas marianensis TaxID=2920428 RepID=A0A9X2H4Y0_9HYPH|nr:bifunctional aminoglycoside phosphotransferase/ATP-binding protein [Aurantimonas marianensis]MCP3054171.1 AAA family ATPase [Aurantimonas marianensis]
MPAQSQDETIAFLKSAAFDDGDASTVETVVTHISTILLSGERAIKLKRPAHLPYVDFSTPERRLTSCEQELVLNRRTAPELYRAVRQVTREPDGGLAIDGSGPLVDAYVDMRRFDEDCLLDRMAMEGTLTVPLMARLAHRIAVFHAGIAPDRSVTGSAQVALVLDINERALATTDVFPAAAVDEFNRRFRDGLTRLAPLLDARGAAGKIRRCHGDLHLRNICVFDGEPTLFDCLEFDEAMATTDILYDLAFLLMDLWHRGLEELANLVLNRYLDESDETDGLPLLAFLMALRAAVRAHVTATRVAEAGPDAPTLRAEAHDYFALALDLLRPRPGRLVAVGGLSGSGKSTVAAAIAPRIGPPPGARILASDRIRKHLFGVAAETPLPAECYRPQVSETVYARLAEQAGAILPLGHGVVADAVFDRAPDRERIAGMGEGGSTPFLGLWLEAPPERLVERVAARRDDPSDATPEVVRDQLSRSRAPADWMHLSSVAEIGAVAEAARRIVDGTTDDPAGEREDDRRKG